MKKLLPLMLLSILICYQLPAQVSIIPEPVEVSWQTERFIMTKITPVVVTTASPELRSLASYLTDRVAVATGLRLQIGSQQTRGIHLIIDPTIGAQIGDEGYLLNVTRDDISITANAPAGVFYGIQTLMQLLPINDKSGAVAIQAVTIKDYPRFGWRGVMLDVSRHFFPKEYVKRYIDQLAQYKFNRFHWGLTNDNGWRVEIKSYPKLTEVGAWRVPRVGTFNTNDPPKPGEKATDGGFYTQDDIREIVKYARDRYIEILPEINGPGHAMAAIASYPELCVTKDTTIRVDPGTAFATWHDDGTFTMHVDNNLNPADENVYKFLDKVYGEIASLFPFEYIHIGGDECYKGFWERDPGVQAFMKKNKIKNGTELQGYFTKRVASIVIGKKKKVIGWDEVIESPVPANVDVMSWRGTKGGVEAARQKRKVVMSPNPVYYLDMGQGEPSIEPPIYNYSRLREVYNHEVVPKEVDPSFILGGQGNLFTEQVPTTAQAEYMTYPRAFAMAESFWSPAERKNWKSFVNKVEDHFIRLDASNINYSPAMYDPIINVTGSAENISIIIDTEVPDLTIHYSYDNTIPDKYSPAYNGEAIIYPKGADNFRVVAYRNGKSVSRLISISTDQLKERLPKEAKKP